MLPAAEDGGIYGIGAFGFLPVGSGASDEGGFGAAVLSEEDFFSVFGSEGIVIELGEEESAGKGRRRRRRKRRRRMKEKRKIHLSLFWISIA